jgi:hypothetical protein
MAVYILYFRKAIKDKSLNLSWLAFLIALTYMFLFYEVVGDGSRNFGWGGRVTLLIVFIISMTFLLRQRSVFLQAFPKRFDWRFTTCLTIFILHLVSGVMWYYVHMFIDWRNWWHR